MAYCNGRSGITIAHFWRSDDAGGKKGIPTEIVMGEENNKSNPNKRGISVIENKKRRTGDGPDLDGPTNNNTELDMGSDEEYVMGMDQDMHRNSNKFDGSKNGQMAGSATGVRQGL